MSHISFVIPRMAGAERRQNTSRKTHFVHIFTNRISSCESKQPPGTGDYVTTTNSQALLGTRSGTHSTGQDRPGQLQLRDHTGTAMIGSRSGSGKYTCPCSQKDKLLLAPLCCHWEADGERCLKMLKFSRKNMIFFVDSVFCSIYLRS